MNDMKSLVKSVLCCEIKGEGRSLLMKISFFLKKSEQKRKRKAGQEVKIDSLSGVCVCVKFNKKVTR